jgi:hypothetical protein
VIVSPYRTTVTAEHQTTGKRIAPSLRNGRASPNLAPHHRALEKKDA